MINVLWREGWIKPLQIESLPSEKCNFCKNKFKDLDFVTSCEYCEIGIIHDYCTNKHILSDHFKDLENKIEKHREKKLHSFQ